MEASFYALIDALLLAPVLGQTFIRTGQEGLLATVRLDVELSYVIEYVVENRSVFDISGLRLGLFCNNFQLILLLTVMALA